MFVFSFLPFFPSILITFLFLCLLSPILSFCVYCLPSPPSPSPCSFIYPWVPFSPSVPYPIFSLFASSSFLFSFFRFLLFPSFLLSSLSFSVISLLFCFHFFFSYLRFTFLCPLPPNTHTLVVSFLVLSEVWKGPMGPQLFAAAGGCPWQGQSAERPGAGHRLRSPARDWG